ncbi:DUF3117 domain-containing protein [Arcanobacterium pinnipediorum]|uniref:DUF3117 domain-containing protein n=1 Tax=Arcanobacterium pinnipediorum TaxID=1503041 RepID=A0ABY5AGJ4_9ACTO|nr:DUF3117 domain-containing protein [Arcanobacterium pinnipediorum]USR78972.1 DUF3117 domain-containing protein [Arcanobacterium pinnipediorum]
MAAMKPRTGDGPLETERSNHGTVLRIPLEGGGRMVLELRDDELQTLLDVVEQAVMERN